MQRTLLRNIIMLWILCGTVISGYAQPATATDSTLSVERIEETIAFLEDSQQVAATVAHLRLLAETRRELGNAAAKEGTVSNGFNLFTSVQESGSRLQKWYRSLIDEIGTFSGNVNKRIVTVAARDRLLLFLLFGLVALVVGLLAGVGLWRLGRRLLHGATPDKPVENKASGIAGLALTRTSFGIGGVATFLLLSVFLAGTAAQRFFYTLAQGYLVYLLLQGLLQLFFAPGYGKLRAYPCTDATAAVVVQRVGRLLHAVLALFLLYAVAAFLALPYTKAAVVALFQVVMTILLPLLLLRLRRVYMRWFEQINTSQVRHKRLFALTGFLLARMPLLLFLYMVVLAGIAVSGTSATYRFFIRGSVATVGVLLAGALLSGGWNMLVNALSGTQRRMLAQYDDLRERVAGNLRTVSITGFVVIGIVLLVALVQIWGINFSTLFNSDIPVVQAGLRIVFIVAGIWAFIQATYFMIGRFEKTARSRMLRAAGANPAEIEKRLSTLGGIFQKIITAVVVVIGVIMIMDELGFDIKAMVAGVGIVGLAVGFGAQNLVRDVISGLFVIFENRIRVGDVAIINGTGGLVEQVNLRTSVLRGLDGTVHVFPNGEISTLSNMTHEFSFYVFDVGVAYKEDTDRVSKVLCEIGEEVRSDPQYSDAILEPLEILGVDSFADSAVIVKARIKTVPIKQWFVGREMNRRIKKRFDELGIEIPFPHRTLYFGEVRKPFALSTVGDNETQRETIEAAVRKVLDERSGKTV